MAKAMLTFQSDEISNFLETGDLPSKFEVMLETALEEVKAAPNGTVAVLFFIVNVFEEETEASDESMPDSEADKG